jgi:hypothetical protein
VGELTYLFEKDESPLNYLSEAKCLSDGSMLFYKEKSGLPSGKSVDSLTIIE